MTPERFHRISTVLKRRQPDLTIVTDGIYKYRNIAAIVRTCDAVGIPQIHCAMPKEGYQNRMGISASADKWVECKHYPLVEQPLEILKEKGLQLIAAHLTKSSLDYREIDYTLPTAIVMGAEVKGVSQRVCKLVDHTVVIPMMGMVESFNVSVACGLILSEAQTQRYRAGFYDRQRLDQNEYKRLFFKWAHPTLADYCDNSHISYPDVGDDGEVVNLPSWYASVRK